MEAVLSKPSNLMGSWAGVHIQGGFIYRIAGLAMRVALSQCSIGWTVTVSRLENTHRPPAPGSCPSLSSVPPLKAPYLLSWLPKPSFAPVGPTPSLSQVFLPANPGPLPLPWGCFSEDQRPLAGSAVVLWPWGLAWLALAGVWERTLEGS